MAIILPDILAGYNVASKPPVLIVAAMGREASGEAGLTHSWKLVLVLGWLAVVAVRPLWSRARGARWTEELSLLAQPERTKYNPT